MEIFDFLQLLAFPAIVLLCVFGVMISILECCEFQYGSIWEGGVLLWDLNEPIDWRIAFLAAKFEQFILMQ